MTDLSRSTPASTSTCACRSTSCARICDEHGVPVEDGVGTGQAHPRDLREDDRGRALGSGVRLRLPEGGLAAGPRPPREPGYVERFEPIVAGRELGNAFSELIDPVEQRAPFEDQARTKAAGDDEAMVVDEDYLRALEYGLPADRRPRHRHRPAGRCSSPTRPTIRDVILFPTLRPEQGGPS